MKGHFLERNIGDIAMYKIKAIFPMLFLGTVAMATEQQITQVGSPEQAKMHIKKVREWVKSHPGVAPPLSPDEEYRIFGKNGLPKPGSGVHVMPASEMHYNNSQVSRIKSKTSVINSKGYIEKYNQNATTLLMYRQIANADYSKNDQLGEHSTRLRHELSDLKMAYDYQGVPGSLVKEVVGFAPVSTYINQRGWTGAVEFFSPQNFDGLCSYNEINISLTGSSANFAEEIVSRQVNDKVTIVEVSGNTASGYGYNIEWWDSRFRHTLECASKNFSQEINQKVITLAKMIDSQKN